MNKTQILIVEDDRHFSKFLNILLTRNNFKVLAIVASGEMAIQKAVELKPDLILMDIELEGNMTGIESAKEIHKGINVPIVYLTGHKEDTIFQKALNDNIYGYLLKPSTNKEILLALELALYKFSAEQKRVQYNNDLEKIIEQRVTEIKEKNRALKKEIEERKKSESELQKRTEDIKLLHSINEKMNRGDSLQSIIKYTQEQTKKLFSSYAVQVYLYEENKNRLVLRYLNLSEKMKNKIEQLIGFPIGEAIISLEKEGLYHKVFFQNKTQVISDPDEIQQLMAEFIPGTLGWNSAHSSYINKLLPLLIKIMGIKSVINIPLEADGIKIGLLDISGKNTFSVRDVKRIEMIAKGLTSVLKKKMDEDALLKSENRNRALLTAIPDFLFILDAKGIFLDYRTDDTTTLYSPPHKFIGNNLRDVMPPEVAAPALGYLKQVLKNRKPQDFDYQLTIAGKTHYYRARIVPFAEQQVLVIVRDETERKNAEKIRLNLAAEFKYTIQKIQGQIFRYRKTKQGTYIVTLSEGAIAEQYNLTTEKIKGKTARQLFGDEMWQRVKGYHKRAFAGEQVQYQLDFAGKWYEIVLSPFKIGKDGTVIEIIGINHDITRLKKLEKKIRAYSTDLEQQVEKRTTELKTANQKLIQEIAERVRIESKLQTSESQWRSLSETAPDIIVTVNREGIIQFINHGFPGITKKMMLGDNIFKYVKSPYKTMAENEFLKVFKTRRVAYYEFESKIYFSENDSSWYSSRVGPVIQDGQVVAATIIFTDITEQKRVQEALQASEKMAATGRMAAQIAHEINNPLAGIKNAFLLLKDGIPQDYAYYHYVGKVEKEINRIIRITRQMFDIYKPEQISLKRFYLIELIKDVTSLLESECREFELNIELKKPENDIELYLSESVLKQALFNIIKNAIEASPSKSSIIISTKKINQKAVIRITDQGQGIPQKIQKHIFDPFYSSKITQRKSGLGLGLSITKELIENIGGTIEFKSKKNTGTTFILNIPIKSSD